MKSLSKILGTFDKARHELQAFVKQTEQETKLVNMRIDQLERDKHKLNRDKHKANTVLENIKGLTS